MNLLIHTPVSNRAWCLPEFLEALAAQTVPVGFEVGYLFDVNDTQDNSVDLLAHFASRHDATINEHPWPTLNMPDHSWNAERYRRMIAMRNGALTMAAAKQCAYLFSIDSDVILADCDTLTHLLFACVPIIAGVFVTRWGNPEAAWLPNVWQRGQNEMTDDFIRNIAHAPEHVVVGGLGACTLIRNDVWESGVTYSPIYNLPSNYRGEDRNFCVRAAVKGFELLACSHRKITHLCR